MKKLIIFLLLVIGLLGCNMKRYCAKNYPPVVNTETVTEIQRRDTTIYVQIPGDTVTLPKEVIVEVEKETGLINLPLQRLDVDFAWATVRINNSVLDFNLYQKEKELQLTIEKAISESTTKEIKNVEVPVYYNTWWDKQFIKIGKFSSGLCGFGALTFILFLFYKNSVFLSRGKFFK
jgi:hypothetical protein